MVPLIPNLSIRDIIEAIKWLKRRNKQKAIQAWRDAKFAEICKLLTAFYADRGVPLLAYPSPSGEVTKVPVYVRSEWLDLTQQDLDMEYEPVLRPYQPSKSQKSFLTFYREMRKELGEKRIWDGEIFRLTSLKNSQSKLNLKFKNGRFFDSIMCQYILEDELISAWAEGAKPERLRLDIRNKVAGSLQAIESFCQFNVSRIGVSNLLLLRSGTDTYVPVIHKRGAQSLGKGFDTVSSGLFDITTVPKADFELKHKVVKEIYEEMFDNPDVAVETKQINPYFFYDDDGIRDLIELLDSNMAIFQVTGFCIDLIRLVPEITTVLVIQDSSYYERHLYGEGVRFKLNLEYQPISQFQIPRTIKDVDEYVAKVLPTDPDSSQPRYGFDPMHWTLPGGFCFYQGLKRAVSDQLL
jgi:hypothetical protein